MSVPTTITLMGRDWPVTLPDYAIREELVLCWGEHAEKGGMGLLRAYAALLGMCTPIGRVSGANYAVAKCVPLVYGGPVYGYLMEHGATKKAIVEAALPLATSLAEVLFPREADVAAQVDFTSPAGGQ